MSSRRKPVQQGRRPSVGASTRIYSRDNVARYSERARQRRRGRVMKRGILTALVVVLLSGIGVAGLWFAQVMGNLGGNGYINNQLRQILVDSNVAKDPFYMLLLGTDGRPGEEQYRSDSIILARIDPIEKRAMLISIPRDTKVVFKGSTMKINATHYYDGPEGVVSAVNELCGIKISHYAEINFEGMQQLIDAVGGIDINATEGVDDPKHLDIKIEPGQQHMDGPTALTYARARYQYADGDYTRMRHQRQVLGALANKILNELDPGSIVKTIDSVSKMVLTDLGPSDIVALANAMRGMDTDGIVSANLPSYSDATTMVNGQSYVFVNEEELAAMMETIDRGEDPKGPQTMGTDTSGDSTIGDISGKSSSDESESESAE